MENNTGGGEITVVPDEISDVGKENAAGGRENNTNGREIDTVPEEIPTVTEENITVWKENPPAPDEIAGDDKEITTVGKENTVVSKEIRPARREIPTSIVKKIKYTRDFIFLTLHKPHSPNKNLFLQQQFSNHLT